MNIQHEFNKSPVLNALFNSMPEMLFVFNRNKKIIAVNKSVERFLKEEYENFFIEDTFGDIVKCEIVTNGDECGYSSFCSDCVVSTTVDHVLDKGEPVNNKEGIMNISVNGEIKKLDVLINSFPFETEGERYIILTMTDITKMKIYQKERLKNLENLAFIGGAASGIIHDLRNPLTGLKGYLYLLQGENDEDKRERYSEKMENALERIEDMISEIMDVASGKEKIELEKESLKMDAFIGQMIEEMKLYSRIEMDIDKNYMVNADKKKMHQVFWNILKNADEANNRENGKIKIYSEIRDGNFILKIEDNGKGIPAEIASKIFSPGKTFDKKNGNGFGLFSSKKIVESHGGEIYFKSAEDKGTTFFIQLPKFENNLL